MKDPPSARRRCVVMPAKARFQWIASLIAGACVAQSAPAAPAASAPRDLGAALDHALLLMYEGAHEFVAGSEQRLLRGAAAPPNTPSALDVVSTMSKNVYELREVVAKLQSEHAEETRELRSIAAKAQAELEASQRATAKAEARNAQLEASMQALALRTQQCEATVVKAKQVIKIADANGTDWQQIIALQSLNDKLRQRIREVQEEAGNVNATDAAIRAKESSCDKKISEQMQKIGALQSNMKSLALHLSDSKRTVVEQEKEASRAARRETTEEFGIYREKLEQEAKSLQMNSRESKAVAEHLAEQMVGLQHDYATLKKVVVELHGENKDLKDDKAQLMDSLQSMLRQSTKNQQDLLLCQQRAQPGAAVTQGPAVESAGGGVVAAGLVPTAAQQAAAEGTLTAMTRPQSPDSAASVLAAPEMSARPDDVASMGETTTIDSYIVGTLEGKDAKDPAAHGRGSEHAPRGQVAAAAQAVAPVTSAVPAPAATAPAGVEAPPLEASLETPPVQAPPAPWWPGSKEQLAVAASVALSPRASSFPGGAAQWPGPPVPTAVRSAATSTATLAATGVGSGALAAQPALQAQLRQASHATLAAWLEGAPAPASLKPMKFQTKPSEVSGDRSSSLMLGAEKELSEADA